MVPVGQPGGEVDFASLFEAIPTPYLVLSRDLVILEANPAYLANVGRSRAELLGRPVFEAFPPTDDALDESGRPRVQVSLERARDTRRLDTMPVQKYDIFDHGSGGMVERFWSLISVPVPGPDGETAFVVQRAEDITDFVRVRDEGELAKDDFVRVRVRDEGELAKQHSESWRRRAQEVEPDLFARSHELAAAVAAQELAGRRLAALAEVALAMSSAESVEDLVNIVFDVGLTVMQARGGAIAVPDGDELALTVTDSLGPEARRSYARLPSDSPLPPAVAALGSRVLVPDEQAAAAVPGLPEAMALAGSRSSASLPLRSGDRVLGSLSVAWADPRSFPAEELDLLEAFAAQCAQMLDRLLVRQAERQAAAEVARMAETLQRSLLTEPPDLEGLQVAVRYQPASEVAAVGGDWYDAFSTPDGAVSLVIGDVAGHDRDAAASMAQMRNVLRGVAQTLIEPPGVVLAALDRALRGLGMDTLATTVLAHLALPDPAASAGTRTLRWSNAGHPPPVLLHADGRAEVLARPVDLLVGLMADAERGDHAVTLHPGDTLLLYTDGLVETRGGDIDHDLETLRAAVARHRPADGPQVLVDRLVAERDDPQDDLALLAVRLA